MHRRLDAVRVFRLLRSSASLAFLMTIADAPWQDQAACHGLTHLFFPEPGGTVNQAKAVCKTCPVIEPCAEAGANEHFGVWGGQSPRQRRLGRSGIVPVLAPISHGTPSGYNTHLRRQDAPCDACRLAHNEEVRTRRYGSHSHPPAPVANGAVSEEYRADLRRLFALLNDDEVA